MTISSTLTAQHVVVDILAGVRTLLTSVQAQSTNSYFAYSCELSLSGVGDALLQSFVINMFACFA